MNKPRKRGNDNLIKERQLSRADVKVTSAIMGFTMIATLILMFVLCIIISYNSTHGGIDFKESPGQIGDIVGGISAPIVGIISAMVTFLAFWIQFSFNRVQTLKIDQQRIDQERARIEGLIFEMIRIHRENVSDIVIKDSSSKRRAFISMYKEFKFCHYILLNVHNQFKGVELDDESLVNISFITFFFGIGESSEEIVNSLLKDYDYKFRDAFYKELKFQQDKWIEDDHLGKITGNGFKFTPEVNYLEVRKPNEVQLFKRHNIPPYKLTIGYTPFNGHLSRLGHYYRHIYQTVDFIHRQDKRVISKKTKYEYVKMLRAQISAHEQLLLYYNSLTTMGKPWWNRKYIIKYKMVKNMPLPLADIKPSPIDRLGIGYFEWSEISSNISKDLYERVSSK